MIDRQKINEQIINGTILSIINQSVNQVIQRLDQNHSNKLVAVEYSDTQNAYIQNKH